jgi:NitT/TauT family transport system permease protein
MLDAFRPNRRLSGRAWSTLLAVNVEAIAISAAIAVAFSYSTVLPFMRPVVGALSNLRFFGLTGFMVVIIMLVGGGEKLKLSLLVFGMCPFFITSMASIIRCIPKSQFDQARSLRMKEWRVIKEVVVYGTADQAFEVLSQNAAIGWMMLTIVEGQNRSGGGIGAMMLSQDKHRLLANVFAIQITIFIFGILQDKMIYWVKNLVCPYSKLVLERE